MGFSFCYQRLARWPQICFLFLGTHLNYTSHPPCICGGPRACSHSRVQRPTDVSFPSQGSCEQLHCVRLPFPSLATLETVIHRVVFPEWKRLGFPSQCNWSAAKGGTEPEPLHISLRRKKKCSLPSSRGYLVLIIIAATINCLNGSKHQVSIPPL